jgi:addiction module RelE/StbE family toxin
MATLTIEWTKQAIADVDNIYDFIAANSPRAARATVDRIDQAIAALTLHPRMGRSGRASGSRELVVAGTPYIIAYRIRRRTVELLGVIHSARRWPDRF